MLLQKQQLRRQQPTSHPSTPNVYSTAEATPPQHSTVDGGIKEMQSQLSKLLLQLSSGESELYEVKHQRLITEAALDKSEMQRDILNQSVEHEKSRVTELQASMKQQGKELEEQRHQIKSLELEKVHATELDRLLKTSESRLEDQRQKVANSEARITQLEEIVRQAGMQLKQQQQDSHNEEIRLKDLEEQLQKAEREVLVSRRNLKSKQNQETTKKTELISALGLEVLLHNWILCLEWLACKQEQTTDVLSEMLQAAEEKVTVYLYA